MVDCTPPSHSTKAYSKIWAMSLTKQAGGDQSIRSALSHRPMACGHQMRVLNFPNHFGILQFGSDHFFVDIPAVRARNVCLSCEELHLAFYDKNMPMRDRVEDPGAISPRLTKSFGPMACGHFVDTIQLANGQRWIWFGPLENCLDVPETRARWVCQGCRNRYLGLEPERGRSSGLDGSQVGTHPGGTKTAELRKGVA
jgi:hypothetical protein